MTSVGITKPGESPKLYSLIDPKGEPVFLDSGSTLTYLPESLFKAIGADFPTATLDDAGFYEVDCAVADQEGTVDFGFGDTIIHVPFSEIIWHVSGNSFCVLGLQPGKGKSVLGGK